MEHWEKEQLLLSEIQVLFSEKRTYLAILRAGLAILTLPFTIIIFLVATANYHGLFEIMWLAMIVIGCLVLISVGGLLVTVESQRKINRLNRLIKKIESEDKKIKEIVV